MSAFVAHYNNVLSTRVCGEILSKTIDRFCMNATSDDLELMAQKADRI
jgi:hypothetical protein